MVDCLFWRENYFTTFYSMGHFDNHTRREGAGIGGGKGKHDGKRVFSKALVL